MQYKPGVKTSEFWSKNIVQGINILAILQGMLPPEIGGIILAVLEVIYTVARALTKRNSG